MEVKGGRKEKGREGGREERRREGGRGGKGRGENEMP